MDSLFCAEAPATSEEPIAAEDPVILDDSRVLDNMLEQEVPDVPSQNYFKHIQPDIEPYMRKLVATWMLEVCEEQGCEDQVFGVAINFLDRFLCSTVLQKTQLQLLGAVCLLLASKIRQCRALSVDLLAFYTENSVTPEEIKKWELVVLARLGWSITPVIAGDYLEHLIRRLPGAAKEPIVRRHASTFIALAYTEPEFLQTLPSVMAMGAVAVAVRGLRIAEWHRAIPALAESVKVDRNTLENVCSLIEAVVERESAMLPDGGTPSNPSGGSLSCHPSSKAQSQQVEFFDGNETPTDVTEIMFY